MKFSIFALLGFLLFQSGAYAQSVICNFTEPFVTVKFDESSSQLTVHDYGVGNKVLDATASRSGDQVTVSSTDQSLKLLIDLSIKGNDGMSDREYDFEGILNDNLYGGCDKI